jgi:hypothetical protein
MMFQALFPRLSIEVETHCGRCFSLIHDEQ